MTYKEESRTVKVTVRSGGQRKHKTVEIKADTGLFLRVNSNRDNKNRTKGNNNKRAER